MTNNKENKKQGAVFGGTPRGRALCARPLGIVVLVFLIAFPWFFGFIFLIWVGLGKKFLIFRDIWVHLSFSLVGAKALKKGLQKSFGIFFKALARL